MSAQIVVWESQAGSKYCVLGGLLSVPDEYEISRGKSRADGFPEDARFTMDKRFPKQVALSDSLSNLEGMVVVSPRLKAFLEARSPPSVEFLPVSIINHKGRNAGAPYAIVNPLRIVDCIDMGRSKIEWNAIDPTLISGCSALSLDQGAIDGDLILFRPRYLEHVVLVRGDVAAEIVNNGFTGVDFTDVDRFEI